MVEVEDEKNKFMSISLYFVLSFIIRVKRVLLSSFPLSRQF